MKGNIVAALVLIIVGTLFLLNNLGYTHHVNVGHLISTWWPAILVVVGLGLLFNRN